MEKRIRVALNRFERTPHSLKHVSTANSATDEITVNLASLYHHYYLDSYDKRPPDPDPANFEYLKDLLPTQDFRFRGAGAGASSMARRTISSHLGQAFCRWFLHDHLNIKYFARIEDVLNGEISRDFSGLTIERATSGDTPDYFCAESVDKVFLAEAKGRYTSVSFANRAFSNWRKQFDRVVARDLSGTPLSLKGYIVATRYATEKNRLSLKSTLFAEDPRSPGDVPLSEKRGTDVGLVVLAKHYAGIADKLSQPILSSALNLGFLVPEEIRFPVTVWEIVVGPLKGVRFVGGYYPGSPEELPIRQIDGQITIVSADPFRLDRGAGTFFGLEETIFSTVCQLVRSPAIAGLEVGSFSQIEPFYSGVSILKDGSIIGPLEFFRPIEPAVY